MKKILILIIVTLLLLTGCGGTKVEITYYQISQEEAKTVIPEIDSVVLVYCRSGNRSKTASEFLAELGYTNIYEFGGMNTWPYEVEKCE